MTVTNETAKTIASIIGDDPLADVAAANHTEQTKTRRTT